MSTETLIRIVLDGSSTTSDMRAAAKTFLEAVGEASARALRQIPIAPTSPSECRRSLFMAVLQQREVGSDSPKL